MRLRSLLVVAMLVSLAGASAAHATGCRDWNRMSESRQWARIDRMIDDAISGQGGRNSSVNRNAIARCLDANAENMFLDFNDLCADASTASMGAIRGRFKHYIWTCVN